MREMPNFTSVKLQRAPGDADYRKTIQAFRQWAGPHVHLGAAGVLTPSENNMCLLYDRLMDQLETIGVTLGEMHGSTLSYSATLPADLSGALQVYMRVGIDEDVWITGMAIVEKKPKYELEWKFQLTERARKLSAATFFDRNGIEHDINIDLLSEEVEVARLAASARTRSVT
jgi:hypothetical protein